MVLRVIKRDGSLEDFEKGKIERVTKAAGLSQQQAKYLAEKIEKWVKSTGRNKITTLQIRDKMVPQLKKLNKFAYNAFVWYQKTKEDGLNSGESE